MKKSIGLTANTSDFRPNLPQTKHLNYFMGTNPIYMAKGGDVKAGIPNYPDVNVTRGFLPAALGFDDGGEANSNILQQIDKLMLILGGDMKKVIEYLKKWLGYTDEQINSALNQKDAQPPMGAVDTQPQPVTPKETVTPKDTVDAQPPSGAVDVTGKPTRVPDAQPPYGAVDVLPDPTSPRMPDNIPVQSLPGPVGSGIIPPDTQFKPDTGISTITPDAQPPAGAVDVTGKPTNPLDLNGDGVVDLKDLGIAAKQGAWDIWKEIQKWLGLDEETTPEKKPEEKPDKVEVPGQGGPVDTVPSPVKPKITDKETETGKDGIAGVPPKGAVDVTGKPTGGITDIGKEEQNIMKKSVGEGDNAKDAPAWALPLMSAGFAMMASKSPNFLQALGEGGQKGLETLTAQKTAEEEKLDKESERKLREAQSKYYLGEGRQTSTKTIVQDGMLYKSDGTPFYITTTQGEKIHAKASLSFEDAMALAPNYYGAQWDMMDETQRTKATFALMEMYKNQAAGLNVEDNVGAEITDEGGGLTDWFKDWLGLKDGGIVSLRR